MARIVRDATFLHPLSDPPDGKFVGRKSELAFLEEFVVEHRRNVFVFGKPGLGKTSAVKELLSKLTGRRGIKAVYVNAGETRSPYYTLQKITAALGVEVPPSGWQMTKLKQTFEKAKGSARLVIVIDEVDAILGKQREPLVYYLNRLPNTTLILISNKFKDLSMLPARAKSSLQAFPILFNPYSDAELKEILAARAGRALSPGSVSDEQLARIAHATNAIGDVRTGFTILLSSSVFADRRGKSRLDSDAIQFGAEAAVVAL